MKKILFLAPVALAAAAFAGCSGHINYNDYISEKRYDTYRYEDDGLQIKVYLSKKETPFVADGIKGNVGALTEIYVKTAQKHEEVTITSASFAGGEMSYLTVRDCMYLSFGDSWQCGGEVTVTLTCDGESSDYVLQSVKDAGVMTCEQALDCVREYDGTLFESLTNGRTFGGEIFIRLLYDEKCYYYVGVCDTEGKICAFLLDGESGRIVAEREHKM